MCKREPLPASPTVLENAFSPQQPVQPQPSGLAGFDHPVKMVSHQAPGVHLPVGFAAGFPQSLQKLLPIRIVQEDIPTLIPLG